MGGLSNVFILQEHHLCKDCSLTDDNPLEGDWTTWSSIAQGDQEWQGGIFISLRNSNWCSILYYVVVVDGRASYVKVECKNKELGILI